MDKNEIVNVVSEEIRKCMNKHIGRNATSDSCNLIKNSITAYLTEINTRMGYTNLPVVQVENEGPFVTINFFNDSGERLETLGDMLHYMESGIIQ